MNRARQKQSLEVVEAESLWGRTDVDRDAFLCVSCDLQVFPASYDVKNRKRPYFSKPPSREHDPLCELLEYERLVDRARREPVVGRDGELPVSYPDRLRALNVVAAPAARVEGGERRPAEGGRPARPGHAPRRRRYAAGSLHLLCWTFIDFPYDRKRLRLRIDGVEGDTYDAIFRRLESKRIVVQERRRLFYAQLKFNVDPTFTEDEARVRLAGGENRGTPAERLWEVRVKWTGWPSADRARVRAEIETTREEAERAWGSRDHAAWVFFMGEQLKAEPAVFEVTDPRAFCCLFAALTYPPRPPAREGGE